MAMWKFVLTICVYLLLGLPVYLESEAESHVLAPTYALVGAAALFVSLVPIPDTRVLNRTVNLLLQVAGAFAAFLTGWYWLDITNNEEIGSLVWVAIGVLLIVGAAGLTPIFIAVGRLFSENKGDEET